MRTRGALNNWGSWEKRIFTEAQMQGICISRLPDDKRKNSGKKDVDFVLSVDGGATWTDAKSTEDTLWNLKEFVFNPKKIHQWSKLLLAKKTGNRAGYLIWFIKHEKICWVPVEAIELAVSQGKFSIHPDSPLIVSQPDDEQIKFRELIK